MKLVNHLLIRLSGVFVLVLMLWSMVYLYMQMTEIHDGIDEGLNNLKQEFIYKANQSPDFIVAMKAHSPLNIEVDEITYDDARHFKETYTDSQVYFVTEEETEEVRMLTTAFFCEQDQCYYKLKFFTSTVESDDLIKNMFYLLLALWICLALAIGIVVRKIIDKSNKPFYKLLDNLRDFRLDSTRMVELPSTGITEYNELNKSVEKLLQENINAFTDQKRFIENASHELQTPLAIAVGKLELMLDNKDLSPSQLEEISSVLRSLNRMKRLNASLLLLSKIKNRQFADNQTVDMLLLFEDVIDDFSDIVRYKGISLHVEKNVSQIPVSINRDLAYILANNLIKNAVYHNLPDGEITVTFDRDSITISNTGQAIDASVNIFDRYVSASGNASSSGLGLAIVKAIADIYKFNISYSFDNKHNVVLRLI